MLRVALWRDFHDAAAPAERRNHIQIRFAVEGDALRPAQAAIKHNHLATLRDAVDAVVTRSRRAGDVEFPTRMKRQVVGGDRGLQRGEYENLARGTDLENRAAAIADEQVAGAIESQTRGDAHSFGPLLRLAVGRDAVDRAVVAAGDVEIALPVHGQPRRID